MGIAERLRELEGDDRGDAAPRVKRPATRLARSVGNGGEQVGSAPQDVVDEPVWEPEVADVQPRPAREVLPESVRPFQQLRQRAKEQLFVRLGHRLYDPSLDDDDLARLVGEQLDEVLRNEPTPLDEAERARLVRELTADVLGYGPIEPFLDDPDVTEVMVNGAGQIYVERNGRLALTDARYTGDEHLRQVIDRIVSRVGRRVDESSPMVDARLPDGSRVNAIVPPLAVDGPSLTIRKFSKRALGVNDLIRFGSLTNESAGFIQACVKGRLNVLVSGGTGTGKTTLLNVVSSFIPASERIVTIEDAVELRLAQDHVVRLEARPSNVEGRGEVTIRDLVRNALRMRPDRIIIGEVRSGEALDMLQAMNTGHEGSLSTLHANTPRDALSRLETMVLMAGIDLPIRAIREQIGSAVDLIIQISRLRDGSRRVSHISEVEGLEGDVITIGDIFGLEFAGEDGPQLRPTGIRPRFTQRLADQGITLGPELFGLGAEQPRRGWV